jgi:hypothetical protein
MDKAASADTILFADNADEGVAENCIEHVVHVDLSPGEVPRRRWR